MASWEDEDFEPTEGDTSGATVDTVDKWDGEDEDDDEIKDNWDDEEADEERKGDGAPSQPKKKKTLDEKIREREEKRRKEALAKQQEEGEATKELTPEEEIEEKLKGQRLQEEADLEIAKDIFGVVELPVQKTIDNFMPMSKEEFGELSSMIVQKLSKLELQTEYPYFLETLIRDCCAGCEAEEIKKISNNLNLLVQEKQKLNKVANKGKKKTGDRVKKTLASGKGFIASSKGFNADMDYDDGYYNEFDDFM